MAHRPPSPRKADNLPLLIALTIACRVRPTTCAASPTVYTQFPYTGCVLRPGRGTRFLQTSVDDYCNRLGSVDVQIIVAATARMQIGDSACLVGAVGTVPYPVLTANRAAVPSARYERTAASSTCAVVPSGSL